MGDTHHGIRRAALASVRHRSLAAIISPLVLDLRLRELYQGHASHLLQAFNYLANSRLHLFLVEMSSLGLRSFASAPKVSSRSRRHIATEGHGTDLALWQLSKAARHSRLFSSTRPAGMSQSRSSPAVLLLTNSPARIIANQPLRAKEASPFVSNKYPVIVSLPHCQQL